MLYATTKAVAAPGAAAAFLLLLSGIAAGDGAQTGNEQAAGQDQPMHGGSEAIVTPDQEHLYENGISVDSMLGSAVVDDAGNEIGEVEDFVISPDDDRLLGVVIETGGFLNIGDNHLLYPFDEATIESNERIKADISNMEVKELSLFRELEGESLQGGRSRVAELIGGTAYSDGEPYGRVDDILVNRSGNILAVVVQPDVAYDDPGYYAWPYLGYYDGDVYDVPEEERHYFGEEPLDIEALQGAE